MVGCITIYGYTRITLIFSLTYYIYSNHTVYSGIIRTMCQEKCIYCREIDSSTGTFTLFMLTSCKERQGKAGCTLTLKFKLQSVLV